MVSNETDYFQDDIFNCIFLNEKVEISIEIFL